MDKLPKSHIKWELEKSCNNVVKNTKWKKISEHFFFLSDFSVENEPSIFISQEKCKNKQNSRAS